MRVDEILLNVSQGKHFKRKDVERCWNICSWKQTLTDIQQVLLILTVKKKQGSWKCVTKIWQTKEDISIRGFWTSNLARTHTNTHPPTHTLTYIYIYIYIYCHPQSVSFYQNSSVWLDRQDSRSWDRNLADCDPNPIYIYIYIYIYKYIYIYTY